MTRLVFETVLHAPVQAVWEFHASVEALHALTPPGQKVEIVSNDVEVRNGALHVIKTKQMGLPILWKARISDVTPPTGFTDTAEQSPFAFWRHRHDFLPHPEGTLLRDTVEYSPPGGPLAPLIDRLVVRRQLEALFEHRHQATRRALQHA